MEQRLIGGRPVSALGLGCARFAVEPRLDETQARRTIAAALDAGITLLDVSRSYGEAPDGDGAAERLVAEALREWSGDSAGLVVATKCGQRHPAHDTWVPDGSPASIRRDCEESLRALGCEVLDLCYLHVPDPSVPYAESVGALSELRRAGWVRDIGISNVTVGQLLVALSVTDIAAVQNHRSVLVHDHTVLDACTTRGIAFVAYAPLAGARSSPDKVTSALRWHLDSSPVVIPLIGATTPDEVAVSAAAAQRP
jgi:aryl-alcohol dehydrogenase-like predicted oxidoreductase